MDEKRRRMTQILNPLVEREGVEGLEVIRTNGECLLELFPRGMDVDTLSQLSATLTVIGESLGPQLRTIEEREVMAEAGPLKAVFIRGNDSLVLGALMRTEEASEDLMRALMTSALRIGRVPGAH